jgi:hypothetical protein
MGMLVVKLKSVGPHSVLNAEEQAAVDFRRLATRYPHSTAVPLLMAMADAMEAAGHAKRTAPPRHNAVMLN